MKFNSLEDVKTFVKNHLKNMKRPALDSQGKCVMLNADGNKCAVGCTIPPEVENPNSFYGFSDLWKNEGVYREQFTFVAESDDDTYLESFQDLLEFFDKAQWLHDKFTNWTGVYGLTEDALAELEAL